MIVIMKALARGVPLNQGEIETLKTIGMFCAVGLFVSLLFAVYGLDLSRSVELSKRRCEELELGLVVSSWRGIGSIIDMIIEGDLRVLGLECENRLIVEDITRSRLVELLLIADL